MNRSVLIVTPFFAPQSHAAVFRAYKLAKYLPQFGWKPYIVTTDTNYLYNEDQGLLDALPHEVEIHRARYIEPTLRGLRMALGGEDRTFKARKAQGNLPAKIANEPCTKAKSGWFTRFYRYLLDAWIQVPDAHWTWETPAVQKAVELIHQHQIPLVLTSANPFTSHRIGYRLQQQTDVRWIADFRDPATHSHKMISRYEHVYLKQRKAEKLAVYNADAITVLSRSYTLILTEMYNLPSDHPIHFITTGLDKKLLENEVVIEDRNDPYVVFVGEYISSYGDQFFRVLAQVIKNPEVVNTGIKCLFIGRADVNAPLLNPLIERYGLSPYIELIDHMPQERLYHFLQNAKAVLLIPGKRMLWWNLYAKLVDYIALQIPVLAIVPEPSEARVHLQRSGLGIFLDGDEDFMITKLSNFLLAKDYDLHINKNYCEQFYAIAQVTAFLELFETIVE